DRLEQQGLACLGRRHDQTALSFADRGHEIEQAGREDIWSRLEVDQFEREDRGERIESGSPASNPWIDTVHGLHAAHTEELLVVLRRPNLTGDAIAGTQAESANL